MSQYDLEITSSLVRSLLSYDEDTGVFIWIRSTGYKPHLGKVAGTTGVNGRVYISIRGKKFLAHRLAWLYVHGEFPLEDIDHINGKPTDNRLCNLRLATEVQNGENRRLKNKNNSTGFLGVTRRNGAGRFIARIRANKRDIHIGSFDTAEEAHLAYIKIKRKLHEFCTI